MEDLGIGNTKEREKLRENLLKWTNAESHIYSIIVKTLEKAPQFKTTAGAGRHQFDSLVEDHKDINKLLARR